MLENQTQLLKKKAAAAAVAYIEDGMIVGLGSGSTASEAIKIIGERVQKGLQIVGLPTSIDSHRLAESLDIPLSDLNHHPRIDLTIDGADEFDPALNLIKGGGGALFREKMIAYNSDQLIIVTDDRKQVDQLGAFPLPVEVSPFALRPIRDLLEREGLRPILRLDQQGDQYLTDGQHLILDCHTERIEDVEALSQFLNGIPGVVEHGLFLGMANLVVMADVAGVVEIRG